MATLRIETAGMQGPQVVQVDGRPALVGVTTEDLSALAEAIVVRILELEGYSEDTSAQRARLQQIYTAITGDEETIRR